LFASAGEIGLAEHMNEAGKRTRAGQELRMIDMPADAGAGRGLFEDVGDFEGPGALAQHLTRATEGTFGTAGRAWLWWLVDHTEGLTRTLRERMDATERELVPEAAAGQVQRVGRRFALVAVAGELATEAGVTGWPAGTATEAARRCFGDWLAVRRGGVGLSEEAEILRQVRQWVQAHGFSARCPRTDRADDDRAPQAINQAGWRKPLETDAGLLEVEAWEWFLYPEVFAAEVCKGLPGGDRAALRLLAARGHLAREGKHYACRRSVRGVGKLSVYVIKSSILDDTGD
jgi:putative DNA primase/helicase